MTTMELTDEEKEELMLIPMYLVDEEHSKLIPYKDELIKWVEDHKKIWMTEALFGIGKEVNDKP